MRQLKVTMQDETGASFAVPRWRLWGAILGAPLLAAILIYGLWHFAGDHELLHALVPAVNNTAATATEAKNVNEERKKAVDDLTQKLTELTKRVETVERR